MIIRKRTTIKEKLAPLKELRPNLVQLVLTMLIILLFQPSAEWLIALLVYIHIVTFTITTLREPDRTKWTKPLAFFLGTISMVVFLFILFYLYVVFGKYGIMGVLFVIVLLVAYRIVRTWKEFMAVKHEAERALFGTTLRERHENEKQEKERIRSNNKNKKSKRVQR